MRKIYLISSVLFLVFFVANTNLPAQTPSPKPTVMTKPDPGTAPASIFIDGLSVLYNSDLFTEIGFVKDHHSELDIQIFKQNACGYVPLAQQPKPGEKLKVEIYETNSTKRPNVFFQPSDPNAEDFRLMPDMCSTKWYQSIASIPTQLSAVVKEHLAGKLVLNNAVFYTESVSNNRVVRTNVDTGIKAPLEKTGKVLGADIICQTGNCGVTIAVTGNMKTQFTQSLDPAQGPYFILVRTHAVDRHDGFPLLYQYIIDLPSTHSKFNFKYERLESPWQPPCRLRKLTKNQKRIRTYIDRSTEYACQTFGACGGTLPDPSIP